MVSNDIPSWRSLVLCWVIHVGVVAVLCCGGITTTHALVSIVACSILALLTGARFERYYAELRQSDADLQHRVDLEENDNDESGDGVALCPNCGEPDDPETDCGFFGCNKCGKEICENCAAGGMCEACDGKYNGTVTVRFK